MQLGCFRCGWNEGSCDIHHIRGRKIENPHAHHNLTHLCPNCHRLAHQNVVSTDELITFEDAVGDEWKKFYFGWSG